METQVFGIVGLLNVSLFMFHCLDHFSSIDSLLIFKIVKAMQSSFIASEFQREIEEKYTRKYFVFFLKKVLPLPKRINIKPFARF